MVFTTTFKKINKITTMKKVIFIIAGVMFTLTTMAQTSTTIKSDMKDLRKDIREKNATKRDVTSDIKARDKAAAKASIQELKADRKEIKKDAIALKAQGVNHPVKKAHKQMHKIKKHHG
jgi:hypothetical protein